MVTVGSSSIATFASEVWSVGIAVPAWQQVSTDLLCITCSTTTDADR